MHIVYSYIRRACMTISISILEVILSYKCIVFFLNLSRHIFSFGKLPVLVYKLGKTIILFILYSILTYCKVSTFCYKLMINTPTQVQFKAVQHFCHSLPGLPTLSR